MNNETTKDQKYNPPVVAGLAPYTGVFGKEQIIHLLKRTMFGVKNADVDFFVGQTLTATIDTLLTEPPPLTDAQLPLNNYNVIDNINNAANSRTVKDKTIPPGQTWAYADYWDVDPQPRTHSLKSWWIGNMINQPRSIFEKMVLFWHNHFATQADSIHDATKHFEHVMLLRKYALGDFKAFTKAMTLDPFMLTYLNGYFNKKSAPDENYARELQELFTLGKGPNAKYTEADVKVLARLLTGWNFQSRQVETSVGSRKYFHWKVSLNTFNHDTAPKQFSSFYGRRIITNTANTEAGALKELDDALSMIFANNEVALYICRRIYRFFVYYTIDETVEEQVIKPMADIFRQSKYTIKPVLKALFSSQHFFETAMKACLIKSPIENIVGFVREFEVAIPVNTVVRRTDFFGFIRDEIPSYEAYRSINEALTEQGQNLGDPPNVAGWPAYYQAPVYHEYWIDAHTAAKRLYYSDSLFTAVPNVHPWVAVDVLKFTDQFGADAQDPNKLITRVLEILYRVPPNQAMLTHLKTTILLGGQANDYYWTNAWLAYKANPTAANINIVKPRLQSFYLFITRNPHYQLV